MTYFSTLSLWPTLVIIALGAACACAAILWALLKTGIAWRLATDIPNDRSMHAPDASRRRLGYRAGRGGGDLAGRAGLWCPAGGAAAGRDFADRRSTRLARPRPVSAHIVAVAGCSLYPAAAPGGACNSCLFNGLAGQFVQFHGRFGRSCRRDGVIRLRRLRNRPLDCRLIRCLLALACVVVAGAAAGFLLFNFHPARIFLGDAGSIPLGFLAGALGYWGWREGVWPVWFPASVSRLSSATRRSRSLKRLLRGEKFWQAHREHYYQRMVQSGSGHARRRSFGICSWWLA